VTARNGSVAKAIAAGGSTDVGGCALRRAARCSAGCSGRPPRRSGAETGHGRRSAQAEPRSN